MGHRGGREGKDWDQIHGGRDAGVVEMISCAGDASYNVVMRMSRIQLIAVVLLESRRSLSRPLLLVESCQVQSFEGRPASRPDGRKHQTHTRAPPPQRRPTLSSQSTFPLHPPPPVERPRAIPGIIHTSRRHHHHTPHYQTIHTRSQHRAHRAPPPPDPRTSTLSHTADNSITGAGTPLQIHRPNALHLTPTVTPSSRSSVFLGQWRRCASTSRLLPSAFTYAQRAAV